MIELIQYSYGYSNFLIMNTTFDKRVNMVNEAPVKFKALQDDEDYIT